MKLPFRKPLRNQKGVVLIWMATLILAMLAFVSLAIDVSKLLATRTQLQNAADAAALAGASAVNSTTGYLNPAEATTRADNMATNNKAFIGGEAPVTGAVVELMDSLGVPTTATATDCKVTVTRSGVNQITLYLAQIVKLGDHPVSATATAHISKPNCVSDAVPIGFGDLPSVLVVGNPYTLVEGTIGTGNYGYLNLPSCTEGEAPPCAGGGGADLLGCQIEHGYGCCINMNQTYDVKTGANVGQVRAAIDARFTRDVNRTEYPEFSFLQYPIYKAAGGNDARVIHVPLVTFSSAPGGTKTATVSGFAAFFLKRRYVPGGGPGGPKYIGEYINTVVQGEGEGGVGTAVVIRLVK